MIALMVMTDGRREYLEQTVQSIGENLTGSISERWIFDDSGDPEFRRWLCTDLRFAEWRIWSSPTGRSGFGGAIRNAWATLRMQSTCPFVFHHEDDFVWNRPVDLDHLASFLNRHAHVAQVAFRRQPWNDHERLAGGIVEQHPGAYTDCSDGLAEWLEHRQFFTTNPTLYRRSLIVDHEWPEGRESEGRFGIALLGDARLRFAYWGARSSTPWVHHIGAERVGKGY